MKATSRILLAAMLLGGSLAFAQNKVVLSYFEDNSRELRIVSTDGSEERSAGRLSFGDVVPVGWTIVTGNEDSVELSLEPNGTIIKLAENTNFKVEALAGADGGRSNDFALGFGKFRAVAARAARGESYTVRGRTTVCGVRGTDFGMNIDGIVESAFVFKGSIDFKKIDSGLSIVLTDGQIADALAAIFQAVGMTPAQSADLEQSLGFKELDPAKVPQGLETADTSKDKKPEEKADDGEGGPFDFLSGILGLEIGSVTIGDETYAKAVITPTFSVGKIRTSLYLPIIYQENMFDPNDWYKPAGNNEWSFGTDQGGDVLDIVEDVTRDLALKFKYLQYGEQRDPFFFKLGSMSTFTIGHGLIMRDYANDAEFPAIRSVGLNLGMDFGTIGFEAIVNDLADIQIAGGRLYLRPTPETFPIAFGFSGIVDLYPARVLGDYPVMPGTPPWEDVIGDPLLLNVAADVDYGLIERDNLSVVLFADVAGMMPYYRADGLAVYAGTVEKGLAWDFLYSKDDGLANYGFITGALGNVGPLDYRAEYRYFTGAFVPSIFDNVYDKQRGSYAVRAADYSLNPSDFDQLTMGIYGEAGYALEKVFRFEAGYFWPFAIEDGKMTPEDMDYLHMQATLEQGVIPVVNIGVSVAYDRWYFVPMLFRSEGYTWFDEYTTVKTTINYGVSKNVDLVLTATTTLARDAEGNIIYDSTGTKPEIATTISIETLIHF